MNEEFRVSTLVFLTFCFVAFLFNEIMYLFEQKDLMSMIGKSYNGCKVNYVIETQRTKGIACVKNKTLYMIAIKDIH